MLLCWNCQSLHYSCSTGSSTMKMAYSRSNCTSNHLGTMMLVFRAACPHQSIDAFITILCGATHTPLEQLSFTKCHECWLQQFKEHFRQTESCCHLHHESSPTGQKRCCLAASCDWTLWWRMAMIFFFMV